MYTLSFPGNLPASIKRIFNKLSGNENISVAAALPAEKPLWLDQGKENVPETISSRSV